MIDVSALPHADTIVVDDEKKSVWLRLNEPDVLAIKETLNNKGESHVKGLFDQFIYGGNNIFNPFLSSRGTPYPSIDKLIDMSFNDEPCPYSLNRYAACHHDMMNAMASLIRNIRAAEWMFLRDTKLMSKYEVDLPLEIINRIIKRAKKEGPHGVSLDLPDAHELLRKTNHTTEQINSKTEPWDVEAVLRYVIDHYSGKKAQTLGYQQQAAKITKLLGFEISPQKMYGVDIATKYWKYGDSEFQNVNPTVVSSLNAMRGFAGWSQVTGFIDEMNEICRDIRIHRLTWNTKYTGKQVGLQILKRRMKFIFAGDIPVMLCDFLKTYSA